MEADWDKFSDEEDEISVAQLARGPTPITFQLLVGRAGAPCVPRAVGQRPALLERILPRTLCAQREATLENELGKAVSADLHGRRIEAIESLEACPNLRTLDLSFNRIGRIAGCASRRRIGNPPRRSTLIDRTARCMRPCWAHTSDSVTPLAPPVHQSLRPFPHTPPHPP
jgi:hypothetical protein